MDINGNGNENENCINQKNDDIAKLIKRLDSLLCSLQKEYLYNFKYEIKTNPISLIQPEIKFIYLFVKDDIVSGMSATLVRIIMEIDTTNIRAFWIDSADNFIKISYEILE